VMEAEVRVSDPVVMEQKGDVFVTAVVMEMVPVVLGVMMGFRFWTVHAVSVSEVAIFTFTGWFSLEFHLVMAYPIVLHSVPVPPQYSKSPVEELVCFEKST